MAQQRKRGVKTTKAGLDKLNEVLTHLGEGKRLTNEAIATIISEKCNISIDPSRIAAFRRGENIEFDNAKALCKALDVDYREILALDEENKVKSSQPSPSLVTPAVIDTTLPPVDKWQGRQEELKELQDALNNENIRLIQITATGGYGKTALAVKFQEPLTGKMRVLWVNFNQPYPIAQLGRWLLEELGQPYDEKWDEETLIGQMIQGLRAESCLLVLNNLETVLNPEGNSIYQQFLSQWLYKGGNSKLLLTSREQPKFANNLREYHYPLPLEGLQEADAIRYVTEDHGLTGNNEELAEFVNKMARHPLLMQLVCSWMIDEFGEGVCVTEAQNLGLNLFDVEGYHRDTETCVRDVITASLARLSQRLGESLTRLSVLRENFDLELAQGITKSEVGSQKSEVGNQK
jgi:hypothetical protein